MRRAGAARALLAGIAAVVLAARGAGAADVQVEVRAADGTPLKDAVVYLLPPQPVAMRPQQAVIDQVNRRFVPHVSVVQAGTAVEFPNSDNIRHSVYSFSPAKTFSLKIYAGRPARPVVFDKPGVVVLGCNIHDSMVAWVLVVGTPYHAWTDAGGRASLSVPPGDYRLRVWHEPMAVEQPGEPLPVGPGGVQRRVTLDPTAAQWVQAGPMPAMPGMQP